MLKLTAEQKRKYLEKPNHCPYCNGNLIEGDKIETYDDCLSQEITCLSCEMKWTDIYKIADIE